MNFNIVFFLVSFINSFNLMFGMSNMLLFPIRRKNKFIISIYLFSIYLFVVPYMGQYATIFMIGGSLLIIASCNKYYFMNTIFLILGYFIYALVNHILLFSADLLGLKTSELYLYNYVSIIFMIVYAVLVYLITYFIGKFIRKKLSGIADLPMIVQALFFIEILCCAIIVVMHIIMAEQNNYPSKLVTFNLMLIGILMTVTILILFLIIYFIQKKDEFCRLEKEKISFEEFTKKTELFYQYTNMLKEKYSNVYSTAQHYAAEGAIEDLKEMFSPNAYTQNELLRDEDFLDKLNKIKILELKSILYAKLLDAKSKNLQIIFHIQNDLTHASMDVLDLAKIVEEFLNNAIDAALYSEKRKLKVMLITDDISSTILVSNSTLDMECSLDEIDKAGVTSKYNHEGLGLYQVSNILAKYRNIIHSTNYYDNIFTQTLEICRTVLVQ